MWVVHRECGSSSPVSTLNNSGIGSGSTSTELAFWWLDPGNFSGHIPTRKVTQTLTDVHYESDFSYLSQVVKNQSSSHEDSLLLLICRVGKFLPVSLNRGVICISLSDKTVKIPCLAKTVFFWQKLVPVYRNFMIYCLIFGPTAMCFQLHLC